MGAEEKQTFCEFARENATPAPLLATCVGIADIQ
jgi:hypothetical protein